MSALFRPLNSTTHKSSNFDTVLIQCGNTMCLVFMGTFAALNNALAFPYIAVKAYSAGEFCCGALLAVCSIFMSKLL